MRTVDPSYSSAAPLAPQHASRLLPLPSFRRPDYYQALLPIEVNGRETLAISAIKVARGRRNQGIDRHVD